MSFRRLTAAVGCFGLGRGDSDTFFFLPPNWLVNFPDTGLGYVFSYITNLFDLFEEKKHIGSKGGGGGCLNTLNTRFSLKAGGMGVPPPRHAYVLTYIHAYGTSVSLLNLHDYSFSSFLFNGHFTSLSFRLTN